MGYYYQPTTGLEKKDTTGTIVALSPKISKLQKEVSNCNAA